MPNPKLPVIYAMLLPDNSGFIDYNSVREKLDEHSFPDFPVVEYVPKSNAAPPPELPPREYWRLLDPGESVAFGDYVWFPPYWVSAGGVQINHPASELATPIRRRVSPPPTCATCPHWKLLRRNVSETCEHPDGPCSVPVDGSGYCHLHPQAQEANRG